MSRFVPPRPSVDDLARVLRDLQRDIDGIRSGRLTVGADIDMRGHRITGLAKPVDDSDAQTKIGDTGSLFAPVDSTYIVASSVDPVLTQERLLAGSSSITLTDNGPGSTMAISATQAFFDALYQPLDAGLTSFAALPTVADRYAYSTAANVWAEGTITSFARTILDDVDAAAVRTTIGAGSGSVTSVDGSGGTTGLTLTGGPITTTGTLTLGGTLAVTNGGTGATDAATARTNLGLVIGTNVQAYDAELAALAGLTSAADSLPYFTGSGTAALTTLTAYGRSLIDDVDAATARTTLGLVIGTNVQAYDAELAALAGLTSAADSLPYFTGSGTAALTTLTAYGRSLIDDVDAAAARTTLGLVIGTNVQAYDAQLASLAALSYTGNTLKVVRVNAGETDFELASMTTMTYPGTGIANSTGSAWGTSYSTTGSGTVVALATSPTLVTPVLGAATGTSLQLSGGGSVGADNRFYLGGVTTGWNFRQNVSGNVMFSDGLTNKLSISSTALFPATAGDMTIGTSSLGVGALYLDESGAGTETLAVVSDTLTGNGTCTLKPGTVATLAGTETLTNKTLTDPQITDGDVTSGTFRVASGATIAVAGTFSSDHIFDPEGGDSTLIQFPSFGQAQFTLSNGANNNIALPTAASFVRIDGPTSAFSLSGIVAPTGAYSDGRILILYNSMAQNMTLVNDATSTAANRFFTSTGADLVTTGRGSFTLVYSAVDSRWIVISSAL